MTTAYVTHPACREHDMGDSHPESPARLSAIEERLRAEGLLDQLARYPAPEAEASHILRAHTAGHLSKLEEHSPASGHFWLDGDTSMCPRSLEAARRAAGGAILAVDLVLRGEADNAFVAGRPPGHHAPRDRAMGFCLVNNVAVAARHALVAHDLERVAIVDFDVHHGNGTEDIVRDDPRILFCSTFQHPHYPYSGAETLSENIVNVPLPEGTGGAEYRGAFEEQVLPRLEKFRPQLVLVSAGFDGHEEDPLGGFRLVEDDYAWITWQLLGVAKRHAGGRLVSVLEGGYHLGALARSAAAHVRTLVG